MDRAYAHPTSDSYHQFQAYKLTPYAYGSVCPEGQPNGMAPTNDESIILKQQDSGTGGIATTYNMIQDIP